MHYYQFNIGDYAKHTRHLTLMEDLAYRRLMDFYYNSELPLSSDVKKLSRLVGMPDHKIEVAQVLEDFFCLTDEGYIQKRIADEIEKYAAKAAAARSNGTKGGRPPGKKNEVKTGKVKPKITQPVNSANPAETGSKANHEPLTTNHKPEEPKPLSDKPDDPLKEMFAEFWDAFGDKRGRTPAEKAFRKIKPDAKLFDSIIAGAKEYRTGRDLLLSNGGTPKMAQGWLTDRRWEDEPNSGIVVVKKQPQTFQQLRTEANKQAMVDFVTGGDDDGFGQNPIRQIDG